MSLDNHNEVGSSASDNSKIRRTFLKRASAVAVIATIPGRSAWAGIAGSIVASGHGSDFQQGQCTTLLNFDSFSGPNAIDYDNQKFREIFGGNPFNMNGMVNSKGRSRNYKVKSILDWQLATDKNGAPKDASGRKGINNINLCLIVMYLNAVNHNSNGIFYPVLEQHGNADNFARYLYTSAISDPAGVGILLSDTIDNYSSTTC